jgi:tetratricopeptide (TPR) repeat protein
MPAFKVGVLLAIVLFILRGGMLVADQSANVPRAMRELRVKQWIELVSAHEPGRLDDALRRLQGWTDAQLLELSAALPDALSPSGQLPARTSLDRRRLIHRGAAMHAAAAMLARLGDAPVDAPRRSPLALSAVLVDDGQQAGFGANSSHWGIGRLLIDLLDSEQLRDPFVLLWYRAAAEFMIAGADYAATQGHLVCARHVLPDEAHIWIASGVVRAHYAAPGVQNALAGVKVPFGFVVLVNDQQRELADAERFLRRAVELDPTAVEAQVRYGWVLVQQRRFDLAFDVLRVGRTAASEPVLQYYASLFLGVAEAALGRNEGAVESFEQAARLFPSAQAPLLALSELAMRRGDRAAASAALDRLLALPSDRDDPWWTFDVEYGRHWQATWSRALERVSGSDSPIPRGPSRSPCMRR